MSTEKKTDSLTLALERLANLGELGMLCDLHDEAVTAGNDVHTHLIKNALIKALDCFDTNNNRGPLRSLILRNIEEAVLLRAVELLIRVGDGYYLVPRLFGCEDMPVFKESAARISDKTKSKIIDLLRKHNDTSALCMIVERSNASSTVKIHAVEALGQLNTSNLMLSNLLSTPNLSESVAEAIRHALERRARKEKMDKGNAFANAKSQIEKHHSGPNGHHTLAKAWHVARVARMPVPIPARNGNGKPRALA